MAIIVQKRYNIFAGQRNSWILAPDRYLKTDNPPPMPPNGFLGTDLPTNYFLIAIVMIAGP